MKPIFQRTLLAVATASFMLHSGCASLDDGPTPRAESRPPRPMSGTQPASASAGSDAVTSKADSAPDWVAVFESPRDAPYADQRVIYVDRKNIQTRKLENLTYYLARTREVRRTTSKATIQELAVICEGTPIAPATSLRGEGSEEGSGNYSIRPARGALESLSQFSTQRIRADQNNPTTFVVRAICLLGMEGKG